MENDTLGGLTPAEGVSTEQSAADSSPESNSTQDITKNLKAEMNRKFSKINDQMKQELAEIKQLLSQKVQNPVAETDENAPDFKRYVDARFQEVEKTSVKRGQEEAWSKALELFPELDQNSDSFDEKFFKSADRFYSSFDLAKDPEAPLKAVKLAALDLGKVEQLAKEKLLKDEARRSRIISEGGTTPRENKKEKAVQLNERGLSRLGVDPEKLKARLKANKDKYGE